MKNLLVVALAASAVALDPTAGHASNISVVVSETDVSGISQVVASWMQDQNPTPTAFVEGYYTTVPVFDAIGLGGDIAISWYSGVNDQLGGFTNYNEDFNLLAPTSYASDENAPTFIPGLYNGVDIKPDLTYTPASYTITVVPQPAARRAFARLEIATPSAAVPEPATWTMMIMGMGVMGLAMRRRPMVRVTYG